MYGTLCAETLSDTQSTIATSSAESELLASVKGDAEGIGLHCPGQRFGIGVGSAFTSRCSSCSLYFGASRRRQSAALGRRLATVAGKSVEEDI